MRIIHVVGARPNFMKVAPVISALDGCAGIEQLLVHTGQHYDSNMSDIFFQQLSIPEPDVNLEVGSGSHAVQTAEVMVRFESIVLEQRPDLVLVYGDVNSTVAVALVCAKLHIRIGHVEAGLRSFDRTMPEEINRVLTDQISDVLFTPSRDGDENLLREGVAREKIHLVGNVMIDTLVRLLPRAEARRPHLPNVLGIAPNMLESRGYSLVTLHRPSNVDDPEIITAIIEALYEIAAELPVIFPVHPRTRERLNRLGLGQRSRRVFLVEPVGYLDFLALQREAAFVMTDSGGVQEETTYLGVPCFTLRENTERPITVSMGTNRLVGRDMRLLKAEVRRLLTTGGRAGGVPPLWDGKASNRIAAVITSQW